MDIRRERGKGEFNLCEGRVVNSVERSEACLKLTCKVYMGLGNILGSTEYKYIMTVVQYKTT